MIQNFGRQVALIKKDKMKPEIHVGRMDTARDFVDVRDGVRAMMLLLEKGRAGEPANICTGIAYSGRQVMDMLLEISGVRATIVEDTTLMRPSDETLLLGDNSIITGLGWKQEFSLKDTLRGVYEDWVGRI
jgi:GDP-4-dehydro-6-deoxy-D-mannose reductase